MELTQAMRAAAAIRRLRPDPVPNDVLYRVLESARFAPSGGNLQDWQVVVVRDRELKPRLKELYLRTWRPFFQSQAVAGKPPDPAGRRRPGTAEGNFYAEHMDELPVHLVVFIDRAALGTPFAGVGWPAQPHPMRMRRRRWRTSSRSTASTGHRCQAHETGRTMTATPSGRRLPSESSAVMNGVSSSRANLHQQAGVKSSAARTTALHRRGDAFAHERHTNR